MLMTTALGDGRAILLMAWTAAITRRQAQNHGSIYGMEVTFWYVPTARTLRHGRAAATALLPGVACLLP